jgi:hypothetical protein
MLNGRFTVENEFIRMYKAVAINHYKGLPLFLSGCSRLQTHILLKHRRQHPKTDSVKSAKATERNYIFLYDTGTSPLEKRVNKSLQ